MKIKADFEVSMFLWKSPEGRWLPGGKKMENAEAYKRVPPISGVFLDFQSLERGQPTVDGFKKCLEPILKKYGDEKHIFWVNLRQEPVIYVNGKPYTARDPENLNQHLEVKEADNVSKMEQTFAEIIKKRGDEFMDKNGIVSKVDALRIPLNQDTSPDENCFDQVVSLLKDTSASTPIVFNCQAGISRTTTAMVMAALMKEFQLATELNCMKGIVPDDILEALKKKKLGLPGIDSDAPKEKNALTMGEFEVIKELIAKYPDAKIAKAQVDKLIDLAAPPPKGTGVQNIQQNYEQHSEIFLSNYWMASHEDLSAMIAEGRGNLEWERKIPDEKLTELKELLAHADFKKNMAKVIKRIYELAWDQFSDLPRGKHKNNSMHKLASKTMIEILPEKLSAYVESKCGNLASTPDFYDVIGQVSWYEETVAK
ncbi:unnamed protein product [Lepeophtheirus salmonis]|uniref:(salmon louse) hypothetical protein n=1 Tax=Lepeophtheirus salmonis TaxID=72036 RepID=A0A7R8D2P5_LEPSM|nr:unnamed protein product [Lepeophtheirus salmonis]CAF2976233.1 unnamed protein product [Lepeophtheirus salmonis]